AGVPDDVARRLEEIARSLPPITDLSIAPPTLPMIRAMLERYTPVKGEFGGPSYHFPPTISPLGGAIQITRENVEVARDTYPWLLTSLEDWWPCFGVVHDGAVVSVCFSSRVGERACAAGVDTLPDFRQR